ncbi:MAG: AAA family ATPase, partial [Pseudomonadota bacterium]
MIADPAGDLAGPVEAAGNPAMLDTLSLSLFRSYRRAEIDTGGRAVLLFGPNGAGKTNLLEAVSMLSPGRGLRGAGSDELPRRPDGIGWRIGAALRLRGQRQDITLKAEAGQAVSSSRQQQINGKPAAQVALGRLVRVLWLTPAMDRLWSGGAVERRRFLDRIAMSFRPGHAEAAIQYEKTMRERNRLLKEDVRDPRWYGALEAQMARAGAEIELNRAHAITRLTAAQESAGGGASPSAFPRAHLALEHPDGDLPVPDPDAPWEDAAQQLSVHFVAALARGRDRDRAAGRSLTGPHRSDLAAIYAAKDQPARLCSTGE